MGECIEKRIELSWTNRGALVGVTRIKVIPRYNAKLWSHECALAVNIAPKWLSRSKTICFVTLFHVQLMHFGNPTVLVVDMLTASLRVCRLSPE